MSDGSRVDVTIKAVKQVDLIKMIDWVFGSCIWVGGACYPDGECEIRVVARLPAPEKNDE